MTIVAILFSIAILGIVGLYVAKPLLQPRFSRRSRVSRLDRLKIQKEAALILIGDLDFDYQTGKLTEDDYQQRRSELMAEAALILQQMDNLQGQSASSESISAETEIVRSTSNIDAEVEAAIAKTAAQIRAAETTKKGSDIKSESQRGDPSQKLETERIICAKCGHAADSGDKFCSICGHTLKQPQHT